MVRKCLRTPQPTSTIVLTATPDNPSSLQITSFKLSGRNFLAWSQSVQLVIRGKGKFGYLDGSISQSKPTDPSFPAWDINNSMVMSWILNSMDNFIAKIYLLYPIAKAIWDVVIFRPKGLLADVSSSQSLSTSSSR